MTSNDNLEESLYDSKYLYDLDFDVLKSGLDKVKVNEISQLGHNFYNNLNLVSNMIMFPHVLLSYEYAKRSLVPHELFAALKARIEMVSSHVPDDEWNKYFSKARKEVFDSDVLPQYQKMIDEAMTGGEKTFKDFLKDKKEVKTYEALLYSAVVWIWCSFEMLMKELWELTVNIGGKYTRTTFLRNLPDSDELDYVSRGRYISIDYLAKYNYNLSNKLGSALLYKFDFTSPNGIREAYSRAFPRSTSIKEALNNKHIVELEAARSVIVHNAGTIDEEYCKKTNIDKSEMNTKLIMNSRKIREFLNSIMDVGQRTMMAISSIASRAITETE